MEKIQCVILAGGLATRMRPHTDTIPKALIPIKGKPFVHYQLEWLKKTGVTDVVLSIGYRGEQLKAEVGDGKRWGLRVSYVDEGTDLKGTGGALKLAAEKGVLEKKFLVTYGDSYLPVNFSDVYKAFIASKRDGLMVVYRNQGQWDTSNVLFEMGQIFLYDKHHEHKDKVARYQHIDYGLSAFTRSLIEKRIPSGEKYDLSVLLKEMSEKGELAGLEVTERFYEIGSPQGLEDLTKIL